MAPDICVRLGRRIRYLRTNQGVTQEVLSGQADLTQTSLSNIETGKAEPGLRTLAAIAKALGVSLVELLDGVE